MAVVRTYECDGCGTRFDKLHFSISEPVPECPHCSALESKQVPAGFSIGGNASKAGDIAQDIMEKDLGFTDMRDNLREGDIAAPKLPSHLESAVKNYWTASGPIIQAAKEGAKAAAAEGRNPFTLTQKVMKSRGPGPAVRFNPIAKA